MIGRINPNLLLHMLYLFMGEHPALSYGHEGAPKGCGRVTVRLIAWLGSSMFTLANTIQKTISPPQ